MQSKLKPCPFCGGEASLHKDSAVFLRQYYHGYPKNHNHGFRIECEGKCHAMTCWWHEEKQAIEVWNRRTNAD